MSNEKGEVRDEKRGQFVTEKKAAAGPTRILIVAAVVAVAVLAFIFFSGSAEAGNTVKAKNGFVRIPVSKVDNGTAAHFEYAAAGNKTVKFFVVKAADGKIRAAADACDVCYAAKLGYQQEGGEMVCRKCGQRFPSEMLNEVSGGCNPAGLAQHIEGGEVVIDARDLEARAVYF